MRARKNPLPILRRVHSRLRGGFFRTTGPTFVLRSEARAFTSSAFGQAFTRTTGPGKLGPQPRFHSRCRSLAATPLGAVSTRSPFCEAKMKSCEDCSRLQGLTISDSFACTFSSWRKRLTLTKRNESLSTSTREIISSSLEGSRPILPVLKGGVRSTVKNKAVSLTRGKRGKRMNIVFPIRLRSGNSTWRKPNKNGTFLEVSRSNSR